MGITHLIHSPFLSAPSNFANANHMMKKIFALLVLACLVAAALGDGTNAIVGSANVVTAPVSTVDTAKTVTVGTTATNTATVSGILASDNVVFLASSAGSLVPFKFF